MILLCWVTSKLVACDICEFSRLSFLTVSRQRPISYINQSVDLQSKSMDWFLYNIGLRRETVKKAFPIVITIISYNNAFDQ